MWSRICALILLLGGAGCSADEEPIGDPDSSVRCCRVDEKEVLQEFETAIFSENGFCIMGRKDDDGYMLVLNHVDSLDKGVIVRCDEKNRPREIFADGVLICLNGETDDGIYVDIFAGAESTYGFYCKTGGLPRMAASRTVIDQVVDAASFGLSLQSLKEYAEVVFSPVRNYLKPEYAAVYSKAGKALAAPGLIFSAIGLAGTVVDMPRWVENLVSGGSLAADVAFWAKFGGGAISAPVSMFIGSYLGLYARYRELYEEHIAVLYGDCVAVTGDAAVVGSSAVLSGEIEGYEPWYDLECGVAVSSVPDDDSSLRKVTGDGVFSRTVDGLEPGKTYRYRAFVISETRMSLWAGILGELAGPLVRYGDWKKFTVPKEVPITGTWLLEDEYGKDLTPGDSYGNTWGMESGTIMYLIFKDDNTGAEIYEYPSLPDENSKDAFSYTLSGNRLQTKFDDSFQGNERVWTIEKLTATNLQRFSHMKLGLEEWEVRQKFKRLK